jgi:hypothetical protein
MTEQSTQKSSNEQMIETGVMIAQEGHLMITSRGTMAVAEPMPALRNGHCGFNKIFSFCLAIYLLYAIQHFLVYYNAPVFLQPHRLPCAIHRLE